MRALLASAAVVIAGCGGGGFRYVSNGGVPVARGSCTDVTLAGDLAVVAARAAGCERTPGFVLPERATAAFWQVGTPDWAGPVIAESAVVQADLPLDVGSNSKGLQSGTGEKALVAGSSDKGLEAASNDRALQTASRDKGLQTGAQEKGLQVGSGEKGLEAGSGDKGLEAGSRDTEQHLDTGSRAVAPITLSKTGSGRATREKSARFVLTVSNVSDVTVTRVAVVDRVDHTLRVEAQGASITGLADGSTLVVFRPGGALGPHAMESFDLQVYAR